MRTIVTVLLAITLTFAAGCTDDQPEPTNTPSETVTSEIAQEPTESPTPTPTPDPSPSEPEPSPSPSSTLTLSPDQQAAADLVLEYFRLHEEVDADLNAEVAPLMATLDGNMLRMVTENLNTRRSRGQIIEGSSSYEVWKVEEPVEVDGEKQVVVYACMDSTGIETIDAETGLPADATPPQFLDYRLVTAERDGWKIIDGGNRKVEACP